jgi:hypothetical protein
MTVQEVSSAAGVLPRSKMTEVIIDAMTRHYPSSH